MSEQLAELIDEYLTVIDTYTKKITPAQVEAKLQEFKQHGLSP